MARLIFVTHPEVRVDPSIPVQDWSLSDTGRRRARSFAQSGILRGVSHLWSSTETKARETATILADHSTIPVSFAPDLGENDRSATGFLPPTDFEHAANQFFAEPDQSFNGWERAIDAQSRIVSAVRHIVEQHGGGDLAIVSHGAVGTLLYCHLRGLPIERAQDQPSQGHYWTAELPALIPAHHWRSIS